jgi:hypothetical protein
MDITNILLEIKEGQGRVEGRLEGIENHLEVLNGSMVEHAKRIGVLEAFKSKTAVYISIAGALGISAIEYIKSKF